jgi:CBS domain containing-hemolysin-like protein
MANGQRNHVLIVLLVLLLLIGVNALFVAAEFASVSVRQPRIQALAEEGHPLAKHFLNILQSPQRFDQYIAACQVGITLSSLILGAYGQKALAPWLKGFLPAQIAEYGAASFVLLVLTALQMILGEILPKSLALRYPTPLALYTVWPMRISLWLLALPLAVLNGSGHFICRRIGLSQESHQHIHSPAEIDYLLRESQKVGVLDKGISRRLRKALHLGKRTVRELMVPRQEIQMLDLKLSPAQMLDWLHEIPFARLPVWRESPEQVIGSISVKHCVQIFARQGQITEIEPLLEPILAIPRDLTVERALLKLREHKASMALVVDEHGGVSGLLTLQDILGELTGNLNDEFKPLRSLCIPLGAGRYQIPGRMRLEGLKDQIGIRWISEHTTTVSGFLIEQFQTLPTPGDRWSDTHGEIQIEAMAGPIILTVLYTPHPAEGQSDV